MNVNRGTLVAAMAALAVLSSASQAATIMLSADADTYLRDATARGALEFMDVRGGNIDFRGYLRFDLSSIPAGATIDSATLTLTQVPGASRNDTATTGRFALYGLNADAGNTAQNWDEATFVVDGKGSEDVATLTGVTDLDEDVAGITETVGGSPALFTISGAPLAAFLQGRYADGGLATFILSNDDATDRGFGIGSKENADPATHPLLTIDYTAIPEPSSLALLAVCGSLAAFSSRRAK